MADAEDEGNDRAREKQGSKDWDNKLVSREMRHVGKKKTYDARGKRE